MIEGKIIWLASYPRSGNTWVRLLLAHALSPPDAHIDLHHIPFGDRLSNRELIDDILGLDTSELPDSLWRHYWPEICKVVSEQSTSPQIIKTHALCEMDPVTGLPLVAPATKGVILIVRHPFDVAVSLAHHFRCEPEEAIQFMGDTTSVLNRQPDSNYEMIDQKCGSWSGFNLSWAQSGLPLLVVRYESLHQNPSDILRTMLRFIGAPLDETAIDHAVEKTRFSRLQAEEARSGFIHGSSQSDAFFRGGRVRDGFHRLSPQLQKRLTSDHADVLTRLGYD